MKEYLSKLYLYLKFKKNKYPVSPHILFRELKKSQYWDRENTEKHQLQKLNDLLNFSKSNVPYYSDSLKDVALPLESLDQFKHVVPLLTKTEITRNHENLKSDRFTNDYEHTTSGSSGDPVITYVSALADAYRKAGVMRFHDTWGIKPNEKSVLIWRIAFDVKDDLYNKVKKYLKRRYVVDVFNINQKTIFKYYEEIEAFKPVYLRGFRSGMLEFAQLMEQNGLKFKNFKPKVAIVTAELLAPQEREVMERVFECKVANEFGSADAGFFAYECDHGSMHINEETNYIYSDENNAAIVTELFNDSMPYINYKNDDNIIISEAYCSCGRTSRIIKEVIGRESGYVIKSDGTRVNQFILMIIFHQLYGFRVKNSIEKFKVTQRKNHFLVQVVPLENYDDECTAFLRKRMHEELGEDIEIEFSFVDQIPREKSGKLRYFIRKE